MKYITRTVIILFSAFLSIFSILGLMAVDHLSFTLSSSEYALHFIGSWLAAILLSLILVLIPNVLVMCFKNPNVKVFAVLSVMASLSVSVWLWHNFMCITAVPEQAVFGRIIEDTGELYVISAVLHLLYAAIITGASLLFYQPVQIFIGEKCGKKQQ